uniref:DUF4283 domain-containing protein n=1 Tax=Cannabis sativa TaxID=3483 RepID=A0A803NIW6_CANSA
MAKTRSKIVGKSKVSNKKSKKKGPNSSVDVNKTKSMEEILGVELVEFSDDEEDRPDLLLRYELQPPLSPDSSLRLLKEKDEIVADFGYFLAANKECQNSISKGIKTTPPILRAEPVMRNLESSFTNLKKDEKVKITMDDIEEEVSYWKSTIVCYVLGANPPLLILEGFARRIWKDKVDKIGMISYGIFLIRFTSIKDRDDILAGGYIFFNKRPVIMKAWDPNLNLKKDDIRTIPIWIQLEDLELKYWGQKSLFKIVGQLGKPIMVDEVTRERDKLLFPRILIEVSMEQGFPGLIYFENEKKEAKKQEWVVKGKQRQENGETKKLTDEEGFKPVVKANNAWHKGGIIVVAWNPMSFMVDILWCSSQLIHLSITTLDNRNKFLVTFVYGFNKEEERRLLWKKLDGLKTNEPWIVLGDTNDILEKGERIGKRAHYSPTAFKDCIMACQLEDVKFGGSYFTWSNKQQVDDRIYSKIDRVLANQSWLNEYPYAEAIFSPESLFDHTPAILTMYPLPPSVEGTKMYQIVTKLRSLKPILTAINRQGFSNVHGDEKKAKQWMIDCQQSLAQDLLNTELQQQEKEAREKYAEKHKVLLSFLQQKSKVNWIKDGSRLLSRFLSLSDDRFIDFQSLTLFSFHSLAFVSSSPLFSKAP